jgi:RHS repeat-associated protein
MKRLMFLGLSTALLASPTRAGDVVEYFHQDALGNVRAVTNQAGQVIERHDYLPFGEECTSGPCANNLRVSGGQPRKFTGKERDQETGLDYFGARYYGSQIGRFTRVDPVYTWRENLADPQRWSRYAYARNNPLRYVDPDGKIPLDTIWDLGNVIYDIYTGVKTGNWSDLGVDLAAAAIPYVPAGAAKLRHLGKLDDVADLVKSADHAAEASGFVSRERRLAELAENAKVSSADRGWIKSEMHQVETGNRSVVRNPSGKDLRHPPGRANAQGHDYSGTQLQDRATHRSQHRYLVERSTGTTVRRPSTTPKPGPKLPE